MTTMMITKITMTAMTMTMLTTIIMTKHSHSTDLSVSGEVGHSTILLAHYIFGF